MLAGTAGKYLLCIPEETVGTWFSQSSMLKTSPSQHGPPLQNHVLHWDTKSTSKVPASDTATRSLEFRLHYYSTYFCASFVYYIFLYFLFTSPSLYETHGASTGFRAFSYPLLWYQTQVSESLQGISCSILNFVGFSQSPTLLRKCCQPVFASNLQRSWKVLLSNPLSLRISKPSFAQSIKSVILVHIKLEIINPFCYCQAFG